MAGLGPEDYVFRAEKGEAIEHKNCYNRVWLKAFDAVGFLPEFKLTIHDTRHTAVSLSMASGADVKFVQNILGHEDATEALNTYSHLGSDPLDEAMDSIVVFRNHALGAEERQAA